MKKMHYGWVMVAAAFLVLGCSAGQLSNCYNLLIVPIAEDLGVARSMMGLSQSLQSIGAILISLLSGVIFTKFRLKRLMLTGTVLMLASYCSMSFATNIYQIYASVVCLSFTMPLMTWMPFSILLNNWFQKRRGFAIGLAFMGSGVAGMIFSSIGGAIITAMGWRAMVQIYTLISALVTLPILLFLVKEKPEDMGLLPYGAQDQTEEQAIEPAQEGSTLAEERKKARFWILLIAHAAVVFAVNSLNTTTVAYLQDSGYSGAFAANIAAANMGSLAIGKIVLGWMYDKFGARKASLISFILLILCLVCLVFVHLPVMLVGVVLGAGIGMAYGTVANPIISRAVFGPKHYSTFTGLLSAAGTIGGMLSPTVFGAICDALGSYSYAYAASIALVIVFGGILLKVIPAKTR